MRRTLFLSFCFAVAACSQATPPPPAPAPQAASATWFICDGTDAPALLQFERDGNSVRVAEYDKPNGAIVSRSEFQLGTQDGAAGSFYTALLRDGIEAGAVRETSPGMLETPGAAYTPRITEVRLGERAISCRWLPRTRLFGFTGRRSVVVHEDADGDLIYTTYDFANASAASPIELSDNAETTAFSAEIRGGAELVTPNGATYAFHGADGYAYVVSASGAEGRVDVTRNGAAIQSEPLIGFQVGDAAAQ